MSDSTFSVRLLMAARASWSCWFNDAITRGEEGGEEGVDMSEKMGELCQ